MSKKTNLNYVHNSYVFTAHIKTIGWHPRIRVRNAEAEAGTHEICCASINRSKYLSYIWDIAHFMILFVEINMHLILMFLCKRAQVSKNDFDGHQIWTPDLQYIQVILVIRRGYVPKFNN